MQSRTRVGLLVVCLGFAASGQARPPSVAVPPYPPASVPQYLITDAAIFTGSAIRAATLIESEQSLSVESPAMIANQTRFLSNAVSRSLTDLMEVQKNAELTKPDAVPAIRETIGRLTAAQALAELALTTAGQGDFGPTFRVALSSTREHVEGAVKNLDAVARNYPGTSTGTATGNAEQKKQGIAGDPPGSGEPPHGPSVSNPIPSLVWGALAAVLFVVFEVLRRRAERPRNFLRPDRPSHTQL